MSNLTSKDKEGRILVDGSFKVCNRPSNCCGVHCDEHRNNMKSSQSVLFIFERIYRRTCDGNRTIHS